MTKAQRSDPDEKSEMTLRETQNEETPSGQDHIRGYHGKRGLGLHIQVGEDLFQ